MRDHFCMDEHLEVGEICPVCGDVWGSGKVGFAWSQRLDQTLSNLAKPDTKFDPDTSKPFPLPEDSDERKAIPIWDFFTEYFPNALFEVAKLCKVGNDKHNPGEGKLRWAREKSKDHENCVIRHMYDAKFGYRDKDGAMHKAYAAWRSLADLQLALEKERWEKEHGIADSSPPAR